MTRGRKPIPTTLKLLRGNPGKRKPNSAEPRPPVKQPPRPDYLDGLARDLWDSLAPYLAQLGVLTAGDSTALAALCVSYARWRDAESKLAEHGAVVRAPSGYPCASPYLAISSTSQKQLQSLLSEFGLTPSSRCRIRLPLDQTKPRDAFEALMKSKSKA